MDAVLQIQERTIEGKKVKTLRNQGITPIHLYGSEFDSASMQVEMSELIAVLNLAGFSSPITLNDGKKNIIAFAREVQRHPLTEQIIHVEFQIVDKDDQVEVEVPVNLIGESPAVKNLGGVLIKLMETIRISSKVNVVPKSIELDISVIESLEQSILVSEIEVAEGVLTVRTKEKKDEEGGELLHRGISYRQFTRKWTMADDIVVNDAKMENGMLLIELERVVPEEKKPRLLKIS